MNDAQKLNNPDDGAASNSLDSVTSSNGQALLHWLGWAEGVSWLLLLLVAVPLKHFGGQPWLVKSMGPVHGGLFVALLLKCIHAVTMGELKWRAAFAIMGASFVPFGPFLIDRVLAKAQAES